MCNEVWKKYSNGTAGSVSHIYTLNVPIKISQQEIVELPVLNCENIEIPGFRFFIIIIEDDENPAEDILFIYELKTITDTVSDLWGYMCKIFQNHNDRNMNRNENEIRRSK